MVAAPVVYPTGRYFFLQKPFRTGELMDQLPNDLANYMIQVAVILHLPENITDLGFTLMSSLMHRASKAKKS